MADDFTPTKPACNFIWAKEPGGDIDFNNKELSIGVWAGKTKKGNTYLKGKCVCGRRCMVFMNTNEGWEITKGDPTPREDW